MKKFLFLIPLFVLMTHFLGACSNTNDPSEMYKDQTAQQIFKNGKDALRDKNYSEAIKRFEALDVQYPYGRETELAQLYLVYAYYMKEEYSLSTLTADRFIRLHPTNPYVDYALYMKGIADYYQNLGVLERLFAVDIATRDLAQIQKAYQDFNVLITRFPYSKYTPPAYQYMVYLRNVLADHQFQVAQFYFRRQAYVASANRASFLIAHYQGAPSVMPALIVLSQSYQQLGMTKEEQDTLSVINYNNAG